MPTSTTAVPAGRALGPVLLGGVGVLLAMDVIGALMAVAAGLNPTFLDALGPQARLSAPLPMMAAQVVLAVGATRSRRGVAIPAAALLAVAGVLAFVSGFYDGGYAAELTAGQRVYQIALVSAHLAVAVVAALRLAGLLRRPARP